MKIKPNNLTISKTIVHEEHVDSNILSGSFPLSFPNSPLNFPKNTYWITYEAPSSLEKQKHLQGHTPRATSSLVLLGNGLKTNCIQF